MFLITLELHGLQSALVNCTKAHYDGMYMSYYALYNTLMPVIPNH